MCNSNQMRANCGRACTNVHSEQCGGESVFVLSPSQSHGRNKREKETPSKKKKKEKNGDEERGVKVCERGVATREQCSHHTQAAGESRFR